MMFGIERLKLNERERGKMRTRERNRSWNMESIWRLGDAKILRNLRHIESVRVVFLRYSHSDAVSISLIVVNNNDFFCHLHLYNSP